MFIYEASNSLVEDKKHTFSDFIRFRDRSLFKCQGRGGGGLKSRGIK